MRTIATQSKSNLREDRFHELRPDFRHRVGGSTAVTVARPRLRGAAGPKFHLPIADVASRNGWVPSRGPCFALGSGRVDHDQREHHYQRRAAERLDDRAQLWPEHVRPVPARTADRPSHNLSRACLAALICCRHVPTSGIVPGLVLCPTCAPPPRISTNRGGTGRNRAGVELNKIEAIEGNCASCKRFSMVLSWFDSPRLHFSFRYLAPFLLPCAVHVPHGARADPALAPPPASSPD